MQINKLDHVNIRTNQMASMIDWYTSVLGMSNGKRPHFPFPGAWLYAGDHAMVHLVDITETATGSEASLKLEHFAFAASNLSTFEARLKESGEHYTRSELSDVGIVQINVWDPDGNHIHLDFPAHE